MFHNLARIFYYLIGDPKFNSLEHRLFNTFSLMNGLLNVIGAFSNLFISNSLFLFLLNFITGILFLILFFISRLKNIYYILYWPFIILIVGFLFANVLGNAGSSGGAHYYLIPALVIAMILSRSRLNTVLAILLNVGASALLFYIESYHPDWITQYSTPGERLIDVSSQYIFVQVFTGILVLILARNFNDERLKSERLLLNILPESIADELKKYDSVKPRHYGSATVLFTDFVGFTKIAENMTPERLLFELDLCFKNFDRIMKKYGIEKIKTIGDAYMAAGGIPEELSGHQIKCILAALEIKQFMTNLAEEKTKKNEPFWKLRLGIHSGPLVTGVIGTEKFAYDVWGDTVNLASRMESSGKEGQVNISGQTYESVKDFFRCEYRGKIEAKNKGEVDMFFVEGIHPELSDAGSPNHRFIELYRKKFGEYLTAGSALSGV